MIIPSKHSGYRAGIRLYPGGDNSGGSAAPTQQTVVNTNVPDYARPYVEDMLGRSAALTDTNQNPFQTYSGPRVAGLTPLQQQAANTAAGMSVSPQLGQATGVASDVAGRAQAAGQYTPGSFNAGQRPGDVFTGQGHMMTGTGMWDGNAAHTYMNPYMQQVVDIQKREAERRSAMQGQQQGADAVANGAYGGTRDALVEAERQRNLGQLENDIQAQGGNAAWQQAQQQFNTDQGRGLQSQMANQGAGIQAQGQRLQGQMANQQAGLAFNQQGLTAQQLAEQSRQYGSQAGLAGLNLQLGAAGQLANIGGQQYGQQMGIAGLQSELGRQQQAMQQAGLDVNYQDFVNRQMYPYRQLEFQNNLVRGNYSPNTTTSVYGGYGSPISQIAGLGTAAYGMSKMMAEGGQVEDASYHEVPATHASYVQGESYAAPQPATYTSGIGTGMYMGPSYPGTTRMVRMAGGGGVNARDPNGYIPHEASDGYDHFADGGQVPGLAGLLISQIG